MSAIRKIPRRDRNTRAEVAVFDNVFYWFFFALIALFSVSEMFNEISVAGKYLLASPALCRLAIVSVSFLFLLLRFRFEAPILFPVLIAGWGIFVGLHAAFDGFEGMYYDRNIRLKSVIDAIFWPSVSLFYFTYARFSAAKYGRMVWCYVALFLLLCGIFYAYLEDLTINERGDYVQSNIIYFPLLVMPWVLLLRNTLVRNLLVGLFVVLALISTKRGGVAAIGLAYFAHSLILVYTNKRKRLLVILLLIGFVSLLAIWLVHTDRLPVDVILERFKTVQEDEGSGRIDIWTTVMNGQMNAKLTEWLAGHGYIGTIRDFGFTAHNDFIEALYNFGLVGLLIYCAIHVTLLKYVFRLVSDGSEYAPSFAAAYVIFFVMSVVSHLVVYPSYSIYILAYFGMMLGMKRNQTDISSR